MQRAKVLVGDGVIRVLKNNNPCHFERSGTKREIA
mgnify:CR=1 FL=1